MEIFPFKTSDTRWSLAKLIITSDLNKYSKQETQKKKKKENCMTFVVLTIILMLRLNPGPCGYQVSTTIHFQPTIFENSESDFYH